ncbi:Fc.00g081930.m01.CDS01 [Cosmosporella sp. VM-42]
MERRILNFNATVSRKLDQWQERRSSRKRGQEYPISEQPQKKIKSAPISALEADACEDLSYQPSSSATTGTTTKGTTTMEMTDHLGSHACKTLSVSFPGDQVPHRKTSFIDLDNRDLLYPSGGSIDGKWSFDHIATGTATDEWALGEWAFANTSLDAATSNYTLGEWAFADTIMGATTSPCALGDWAFAHTGAPATSDNAWASASTAANTHTDNNGSVLLDTAP